MEHGALPADVQSQVARLKTADILVGLPMSGPGASGAGAAAAVRSGLETHFSERTAVVVHVEPATSEGPDEAVTRALGELPIVRVQSMGADAAGAEDLPPGRDEAIRTILAVGRAVGARAIVVLNPDLSSTSPGWLAGLAGPVLKEDYGLVLPLYQRSRYEGTLTHALVVPLIRALYGRRLAHPLAEEFGCSLHAAGFFLGQDVWGGDLARNGLDLWLAISAIEGGLAVGQASLGPRTVAANARAAPLGATVGRVASSLFALVERSEATWMDLQGSEPAPTFGAPPTMLPDSTPVNPERMLIGFRQGVRDLYPVWERILAPENLGEVLVLSDAGPEEFRFPDRLWARVVYDFLLAYRARVVYRTHVAQSLAPLYLGRAASVILETRARPPAAVAEATERLGREFEDQKPYLVERWR